MEMKSTQLNLRALEPQDIETLYDWENDFETWKYTNTLVPFSKFDLEQFVLSSDKDPFIHKQVRFMIEVVSSAQKKVPVGTIDLYEFDPINKRAGVGVMIIQEERGKHYASMALEKLKYYAFNILNLHQIFCNIASDNTSSIHLFEGAGFEKSGVKKEWIFSNNGWKDELTMQLINKHQ